MGGVLHGRAGGERHPVAQRGSGIGPERGAKVRPITKAPLTTVRSYLTMATEELITIPLHMPAYEADAFAQLIKRTTYSDCVQRSNRLRQYPDGRQELDVMWAAVRMVELQFAEAGFAPR